MSRAHTLIKGTLILTMTGLATRMMGFFYRIFLSHAFGEEGVGLYQLIFPVYALGFSLTCAGIELILARLVAKDTALGRKKRGPAVVVHGPLNYSFFFQYCNTIPPKLCRMDRRGISSRPSLCRAFSHLILCLSFCRHSQLYLRLLFRSKGNRRPCRFPADRTERTDRQRVPYLFCSRRTRHYRRCLLCRCRTGSRRARFLLLLPAHFDLRQKGEPKNRLSFLSLCRQIPRLLLPSLPLTGNRVLLNLLQSAEAVSIPLQLKTAGMTQKEALSVYGVLTGMALPCILFPSAVSGSISTMLLPEVARIQTLRDKKLSAPWS